MRKAQRNTAVALIALSIAGLAFIVAAIFMWPDLFNGLQTGRYPLIILALCFLFGPAIVAVLSGAFAFVVALLIAYAVVPVED